MGVILVVISVVVALLISKLIVRRKRKDHSRLPPGSLGWPVVGETFRFTAGTSTDFYDDRAAKYGPVFKTSLIGSNTVVLPAPEGNRVILMGENKLVQMSFPKSVLSILGKNSLVSKKGEEHRRYKNHLMSFLRPETLQRLVGRASRVAEEHLEEHWKGKSDEVRLVYPLMKKFTFTLACNLFMGLDLGDDERELLGEYFEILKRGLFRLPLDLPWTDFHRAKCARKKVDQVLDKVIQKRRAELRKTGMDHDMLEVLFTTRDENGELSSDSEIKDSIVLLLFAGHDTSSVALTWVFKFLAENPSCMERVFQENLAIKETRNGGDLSWEDLRKMKYTWLVFQETMRMRAPVGGGFREALKDIEFKDYVIPKGWKLNWSTETSYRKEEFFHDPLKFNPSRFKGELLPYTYLPFGAGPRMCPGNEFAKMELLIFLHHLILCVRWTLMEPEEGFVTDPMPRPINDMPVMIRNIRPDQNNEVP